ncbi:MAG: hypothetical protein ACOZCO_04100 [Bacteroidota bacterium]
MTFWKRIRYYLIGVSIGLVVSFFFFQGRGCAWLPGNRVMKKISESMILRTDSIACVLKCHEITDEDIFTLFTDGDVLFSESETHSEPKKYVLEGNRVNNGHSFKLKFIVRDSTSLITEVISDEKCECGGKNDSTLHIVNMPDNMVKKVLQQRNLTVTSEVKCKMDCYELQDKDIYQLIENGEINKSMSTPRSFPYPVYYISNNEYELKMEITPERSRVLKLQHKKNHSCTCTETE